MTAPRILIDLAWMIPGQAGGLEDVAFSFLSQVLARADLGAKAGVLTLIVPSQIVDAFRAMIPATVSLRTRDDVASDALRLLRVLTRNHAPAHGGKYDVIYSMNARLRPVCCHTGNCVGIRCPAPGSSKLLRADRARDPDDR
jgi:hypothetical protein